MKLTERQIPEHQTTVCQEYTMKTMPSRPMRLPAILFLVALVALNVAPAGADQATAKRDIQAVYNKIAAAMKRKDIDAIAATGTKDFKSIAGGQSMNGEQSLAIVKQELAALNVIKSVRMDMVSIKFTGDNAAETVMRSRVVAAVSRKGKTHTLVSTGSSHDHWVKTPDKGWLLQSVEDMPGATMTLDGKPYNPAALPGK
jgi:ketosteroid isomerase-like protein